MPSLGPQQVYVIQHDLGPVKIGRASNPKQRLGELQVSCPFNLELKKTETPHDAKEVEEYLHNLFRGYRIRGEWFDLPPGYRDFEIPTHIDDSGKPNVEVEMLGDRDIGNEWADVLDRVVQAMLDTIYLNQDLRQLRSEWREFGDGFEEEETDSTEPKGTRDLPEVEEDTPTGKVRCSQCGHHFDRGENGCPTCGSGAFSEGPGRY